MSRILDHIIFAAVCLLLLISCEERVEWPLQESIDNKLVVDALLTNEIKRQEIFLSESFPDVNQMAPPIIDALVIVSANGVDYTFEPDPSDPGRFLSVEEFSLVDRLDYSLRIEWEGEQYTATSELSDVFPIPEITFTPNDSMLYSVPEFAPIYSPNQEAMYELDLSWIDSQLEVQEARLYYYSFNSLEISSFIRPDRQQVFFPAGTQIIIRKYGLNEDYADYLQALVIETEWNGSLFYTPSENIPSNIEPHAFGYFAACSVLTDTLIVK